jgi:hypothetical protein
MCAAHFNARKLPRAAPDERNVLAHQAVAEKKFRFGFSRKNFS